MVGKEVNEEEAKGRVEGVEWGMERGSRLQSERVRE